MGKAKSDPPELRPIGARALKSARDTLRPYLRDANVLDLFAGQGRFGVAALEEGAKHVTFVEKSARTAKEMTRYEGTTIVVSDALMFLARSEEKYEVIFADPPFPLWSKDFETKLFSLVARVAASGAIFLVKHPSRVVASSSIPRFSLWKTTPFGESDLIYFRYDAKSEEGSKEN